MRSWTSAPLVRLPVHELAAQAHRAVVRFAEGRLRDDLCILVLRPRAGPAQAVSRR
jgi:hypothetical protein